MATLEQTYDERIRPLLDQIIAIAREVQMPMVAKFQLYDLGAGERPWYSTTTLSSPREDKIMRTVRLSMYPEPVRKDR